MSAVVMPQSSSNLFRNNRVTEFVGIGDTETVIIARPGILVRLKIYILIGNTRFASH